MKTINALLIVFLITLPVTAFSQYVAQTLQDRINNDQSAITLDQQDIAAKQADIDSIVNDAAASTVTATVPAIQTIESANVSVNATPVSEPPTILNSVD